MCAALSYAGLWHVVFKRLVVPHNNTKFVSVGLTNLLPIYRIVYYYDHPHWFLSYAQSQIVLYMLLNLFPVVIFMCVRWGRCDVYWMNDSYCTYRSLLKSTTRTRRVTTATHPQRPWQCPHKEITSNTLKLLGQLRQQESKVREFLTDCEIYFPVAIYEDFINM